MILIADSGSTKCDWILFDKEGEVIFKTNTAGLNPNILTTQMLHKRIARSPELSHVKNDVKEIYFYGAGCGTDKNQIRLQRFLEKYFRWSKASVAEDLLGACLSVTDKEGIVCILGTGSNACYFDGKETDIHSPSLGYMIMDEASGNYFGKQLLKEYFYGRMPDKIAEKFESSFDCDPQVIKNNLYKGENPNVYLADFVKFFFLFDPIPDYLIQILSRGFQDFIDHWIKVYPQSKSVPIHFVGSVAYHSRKILEEVLKSNGLTLGKVEQHPIKGLTEYFKNKIKSA